MYEFLLLFEWPDKDVPAAAFSAIETYRTVEEMLAAYAEAKEMFKDQIEENRLIISAAVKYPWTDFE